MNLDPSNGKIARESVFSILNNVEHPEITLSLVDLGMIIDVAVEGKTARIALALPKEDIPVCVIETIEKRIKDALKPLELEIQTELFDMTHENRLRFIALARENWRKAR